MPRHTKSKRNKPRLHLALYARPKHPDAPHLALLICPKTITVPHPPSKRGPLFRTVDPLIRKHHIKNTLQMAPLGSAFDGSSSTAAQPWVYEQAQLASLHEDPRLLFTVVMGKLVEPADEVAEVLRTVPLSEGGGPPGGAGSQTFDCVEWVRRAVEVLREQGAVTGMPGWDDMRERSMAFLQRERAEGRWDSRGVAVDAGGCNIFTGSHNGPAKVPVLDLVGGAEKLLFL